MGRLTVKGRVKKIAFTQDQMLMAKKMPKFIGREVSHREFVEHLFLSQHKVIVLNHELLHYTHKPWAGGMVFIVEGQLGLGLGST